MGAGKSPALGACVAGLLALILYSATVEPQVFNATDNIWYVPTTQSLLTDGDFELAGQYAATLATFPTIDHRAITLPSGRFNYFGFGPSVAIVPLVVLGNVLYDDPPGFGEDMRIAAMAARVLAALSVAVLYLVVLRLTGQPLLAGILAAVFAVATPHLSIHAGGLWSHNVILLCYLVAVWFLASPDSGAWRAVIPLAFAFYCRPGAAVPIALTLGFFVVRGQWRDARRFGLVGLVLLGVMLLSWKSAIGMWLPPYHAGESYRMAVEAFGTGDLVEALMGTLLSPNRGLWVFMPIALLSMAGIFVAWAEPVPHRALFRLLTLWLVFNWLMVSSYPHWWLGHSFGPRGWAEMFGVLVILLLPLTLRTYRIPRTRTALVVGAVVLAAAGVYINARGAYCPGASTWNGTPRDVDRFPDRVWDYKDWQVLRARCGP